MLNFLLSYSIITNGKIVQGSATYSPQLRFGLATEIIQPYSQKEISHLLGLYQSLPWLLSYLPPSTRFYGASPHFSLWSHLLFFSLRKKCVSRVHPKKFPQVPVNLPERDGLPFTHRDGLWPPMQKKIANP